MDNSIRWSWDQYPILAPETAVGMLFWSIVFAAVFILYLGLMLAMARLAWAFVRWQINTLPAFLAAALLFLLKWTWITIREISLGFYDGIRYAREDDETFNKRVNS